MEAAKVQTTEPYPFHSYLERASTRSSPIYTARPQLPIPILKFPDGSGNGRIGTIFSSTTEYLISGDVAEGAFVRMGRRVLEASHKLRLILLPLALSRSLNLRAIDRRRRAVSSPSWLDAWRAQWPLSGGIFSGRPAVSPCGAA
jgi:hypothetical protein